MTQIHNQGLETGAENEAWSSILLLLCINASPIRSALSFQHFSHWIAAAAPAADDDDDDDECSASLLFSRQVSPEYFLLRSLHLDSMLHLHPL